MDGKVVLVTGAGSGVGEAVARDLASRGARVAVNDIREDAAREVAERIEADGGQAIPIPADVADGRQVLKMFTGFLTVWSTLDVVVHCAGVWFVESHVAGNLEAALSETLAGGRPRVPLEATMAIEDATWERTIAVHLNGAFHCAREALKVMTVRRQGKIIHVTSVAGLAGLAGAPDFSAAAGGVVAFTRSLAREVAPLGIQVNALALGFVDTPHLDALTPEAKRLLAVRTPLGRLGRVDEAAAAVRYLAADDADFVTGEVLNLSGGMLI